jgi:actin-like ATPase involved in cell morphogenesis
VTVADAPLECVALGAGSMLEERRALERTATRRSHVPLLRHTRRRS